MPHSLILRKHRISPRLPPLATKTGEKCGRGSHTSQCGVLLRGRRVSDIQTRRGQTGNLDHSLKRLVAQPPDDQRVLAGGDLLPNQRNLADAGAVQENLSPGRSLTGQGVHSQETEIDGQGQSLPFRGPDRSPEFLWFEILDMHRERVLSRHEVDRVDLSGLSRAGDPLTVNLNG